MDFVRIGTLVEHRTWGRGKVLALSGQNVQAYFPALASDADGPFRLVREVVLTIAATQSDPVLDQAVKTVPRIYESMTQSLDSPLSHDPFVELAAALRGEPKTDEAAHG